MAAVCPDSYAHALDGLYRVAREGERGGPWRGGGAGRGRRGLGRAPDVSPSCGRGSEEAVLGRDHGVQSRDAGHRGPGAPSPWGGRDPGRLASALREVPQEGSGHGMRAGRGLVGPPPPGVVTVGDPQSRWFGLCPAGGVGLGCFPRAGGSPSCPDLSALPQLSCYDQAKQLVLSTGHLSDGIFTHFIASFIAVSGGVPLGGSQGSERQQALASLLEAPRVPQSLGWDGPR